MRQPRIFIIAPEFKKDGSPLESQNLKSYEAIAAKISRLELEAVFPNHANEPDARLEFLSVVLQRSAALKHCDMALLVPGWQDCVLATKMRQTAEINGVYFHPLMNGYDALKDQAHKLISVQK